MTSLGRSGNTENKNNLSDSKSPEELIALAVSRVREAIDVYKPVWISGALSGGHDSLTACYIASLVPEFRSQFHCDTGVGLKATEDFVELVCLQMGWKLEVFKALTNTKADGTSDPMDYFSMLEDKGFPGPAAHWLMYIKLKERQIFRFVRSHKINRKDKVMLVCGGRRQESAVRSKMGRIVEHYKQGSLIWSNPILDFSKLDCSRIMERAKIPRSPVVDLIHKSGECLCGAFSKPGELEETALWFPDDPCIVRLKEADERLKKTKGWGWGGRPPKKNCQIKMPGQMCSSCTQQQFQFA